MIPLWFQEAIDHPSKSRGIDILLNKILDWYYSHDFELVDNFLAGLEEKDFASIPNTLMVGILCDTLSAAHLLPSRSRVYGWVYAELERRDRPAKEILKGLKEDSLYATKAHNQIFGGLLGGPTIPEE